ncbi:MAG: site-specific integrase, partial [Chlorobiaceae bacterium]
GGYLGVIKKIIKKAWREGYIREDFTGKVACIKKTDIHRRFCTFEEVEALSRARCDHEMVKHAFLFSCFSGLRLSDIELLTWDTISLVNGAPFIQFQQKKTRQFENCPLPEQAVKILTEVKRIHPRYAPDGSNKVFILPDRSSIGIMLKIWGGRAGLSWSLHFHASRHTMATLMLTAGSDIYTVSKQLGHRDIATTQKYSRLIDTKRVAEVQRLPVLSAQPQPVETVPLMIEAKHEEKMQQEPVLASQAGSIAEALQVKGEKIASALSLQRNGEGKYLFNGKEYSAVELALQV